MRNAYTDEAITARYHTKVVSMVAIERAEIAAHSGTNVELEFVR
jgi:propanediol dehydratase large subunit